VDAEDEGLECKPELLLHAFELAGPYAVGKSHKAKLENRMELALCLADWALRECDRGMKLLELTAQMELTRRNDPPSNIVIWP
jgi:hypothetical protein